MCPALCVIIQMDSNDQPPPVVPRKDTVAEISTGKALPNTYVGIRESKKIKGKALTDCISRFKPQ